MDKPYQVGWLDKIINVHFGGVLVSFHVTAETLFNTSNSANGGLISLIPESEVTVPALGKVVSDSSTDTGPDITISFDNGEQVISGATGHSLRDLGTESKNLRYAGTIRASLVVDLPAIVDEGSNPFNWTADLISSVSLQFNASGGGVSGGGSVGVNAQSTAVGNDVPTDGVHLRAIAEIDFSIFPVKTTVDGKTVTTLTLAGSATVTQGNPETTDTTPL